MARVTTLVVAEDTRPIALFLIILLPDECAHGACLSGELVTHLVDIAIGQVLARCHVMQIVCHIFPILTVTV